MDDFLADVRLTITEDAVVGDELITVTSSERIVFQTGVDCAPRQAWADAAYICALEATLYKLVTEYDHELVTGWSECEFCGCERDGENGEPHHEDDCLIAISLRMFEERSEAWK